MTLKFKAYRWEELRSQVHLVNPKLADIIDELSPPSDFTLYKAVYPYGSRILRKGDLYLPSKGGLVSLKDGDISPTVKDAIGYNLLSNPVTLVLKNAIEMFIPIEDRIIPFSLARAGDVFGLWTVLDGFISHCPPLFVWDMTAGARSLGMLSKISDSISHRRLIQHFQLSHQAPKGLLDHWSIFREIANDPSFGDPWTSELLFFSKKWIDHLKDPAWITLRAYLQDMAWKSSAFWRNQYTSNLVWTHIQRQEGIKPSPYVADIVKSVLAVGVGALPGFAPAMDDSLAPVSRIQSAYLDVYRLKEYAPILMQPDYFSFSQADPVYSSLQFLTAMELSPKSNDRSSAIADLYSVQSLISRYFRATMHGGFNLEGARLYDMVKNVEYHFYHTNTGEYPKIIGTNNILKRDDRFAKILANYPGTKFPSSASFLRGCIGISKKK